MPEKPELSTSDQPESTVQLEQALHLLQELAASVAVRASNHDQSPAESLWRQIGDVAHDHADELEKARLNSGPAPTYDELEESPAGEESAAKLRADVQAKPARKRPPQKALADYEYMTELVGAAISTLMEARSPDATRFSIADLIKTAYRTRDSHLPTSEFEAFCAAATRDPRITQHGTRTFTYADRQTSLPHAKPKGATALKDLAHRLAWSPSLAGGSFTAEKIAFFMPELGVNFLKNRVVDERDEFLAHLTLHPKVIPLEDGHFYFKHPNEMDGPDYSDQGFVLDNSKVFRVRDLLGGYGLHKPHYQRRTRQP